MELLNSFGPVLHRYEGVGELIQAKPVKGRREKHRVSFEALQLENGEVVVGWMADGFVYSLDVEKLVGVVRQPLTKIVVHGLQMIGNNMSPGISSGIAYAAQMQLEGSLASKHNATRLEFSVVNLAFSQAAKPTAPLEVEADGYSLRFSPSPDYEAARERLRHSSGVVVTANCSCERLDKEAPNPRKAAEVVDSVCVALSLATGNKVTWINWRSVAQPALMVSVHRPSVTKRYGGLITARGWQLDLAKAVTSWVAVKEKSDLRPMVDYFLDAASQGPYLETRALTAASLLDALTNHYAEQRGFALLLDEDEWRKARPRVRKALAEIDPSLQVNANALRRCPFKAKLTRLLGEQKLESTHVDDVVKIRDALVHSGRFLEGPPNLDQYFLVLRTAFAILARLSGYSEEILAAPTSPLA
jgi:hypothetical protein